ESGKKIRATRDRRNCSPLCRLDGRSRLGKRVNLVLLIAFVPTEQNAGVGGSQNLGGIHRLFASANLGRTKLPNQLSVSSGRWQVARSTLSSRITATLTTRKHSTRYSQRGGVISF